MGKGKKHADIRDNQRKELHLSENPCNERKGCSLVHLQLLNSFLLTPGLDPGDSTRCHPKGCATFWGMGNSERAQE